MMRDTYRDYITDEELVDCLGLTAAGALVDARRKALWERSGGTKVKNATLYEWYDPSRMVHKMAIKFDASAWVGM